MDFEDKLEEMEAASNYRDKMLKLSPMLYYAIEKLKKNSLFEDLPIFVLNPTIQQVEINGKYRSGVYLQIFETKMFLTFQMAEDLVGPYGHFIADEIVFPILKETFKEEFEKFKKEKE